MKYFISECHTVKSRSCVLKDSTEKKGTKRKKYHPISTHCNLQKSNQTYTGKIELYSDVSEAVLAHPPIHQMVACPMQLCCRLNHENTFVLKSACFTSQASLV